MSHPILAATSLLSDALTSVADSNPTFMSTTDKATALVQLARVEARVAELRLRVSATAADVAESTGAADIAAWAAEATKARHEDARADLHLATALDRRYPTLGAALREGRTTLDQARVITKALDALRALPDAQITPDLLDLAEQTLIGNAADFGPRPLTRLGRRILDVIAPDIAEAAEARRLAGLEADAKRKTRLHLRRLGNGTTRISGILPDTIADRFATYLEAFTNPRHHSTEANETESAGETETAASGGAAEAKAEKTEPGGDPLKRLPLPHRLGEAFCALLEGYDAHRLPLHGGDATTVIITITLASLLTQLGTADLLTGAHIPGPDTTDSAITAAQARRLACTAGLIPAVLGGDSEILDLGRTQRLFNKAQRKAMRLRDRQCRAQSCDIPATWCEAHHWHPWSQGGHTNLKDGVLLCSHHHHRAHDPTYTTERQPNGDITFHRSP